VNRSRIAALVAATALLVVAAFVRADGGGTKAIPLMATFIGNMAFAITDGTTTIYTDFPYESGYSGYMTYDFAGVPKVQGALCLVTHGHRDHFDAPLFSGMDAVLIAPPDVEARVPKERTIPFAPKMRYRDVAIEAFSTPHAAIGHASYLVTWHGLRLYFTGDTDDVDQLLAMKDLDVAFVSPWLIEKVAERKGRIGARQIVCYHHQTGEKVPALQNRVVPAQGETLALPALTAATAPR
jgi:hypothetical protein